MALLLTPHDVMAAIGIAHLPRYEDVGPIADTVGFFAFRRYPPDSRLAQVVTRRGAQDAWCLVQLSVAYPERPISPLRIDTVMVSRWRAVHLFSDYDFTDPDCPTPESVQLLRRARNPLQLSFRADFFYDAGNRATWAQACETLSGGSQVSRASQDEAWTREPGAWDAGADEPS